MHIDSQSSSAVNTPWRDQVSSNQIVLTVLGIYECILNIFSFNGIKAKRTKFPVSVIHVNSIAAKIPGSIGILPRCVLNDFFT